MRLWHYKLIPFLPNSQLLGQWRELNSIFKKEDKHILINYVYEYSKSNLEAYSFLVLNEMCNRGMKIHSFKNFAKYFHYDLSDDSADVVLGFKTKNVHFIIGDFNLFERHHTRRYLLQCFYNLQEKYDRGQKDFTEECMNKLINYIGYVDD